MRTKKNGPAELIIANKELAFQHEEKEKRATELIIANKELAFQNEEKGKRAAELMIANKELESFNYISSHDLQEPLRQIQNFASRIITNEQENLSDKGKIYFEKMNNAANRMQTLIVDLLAYSRASSADGKFEITHLNSVIEDVKAEFKETIDEKHATIEVGEMGTANVIPFQFRQLMHNIIGNSLKFSNPEIPLYIKIACSNILYNIENSAILTPEKEYTHISIADNGIGFEPQYKDRIFEVFQRLHDKQKITGTGIGLAIVKKIVENHHGIITARGELNKGATFDIYLPIQ
jgi:light-regulated signal transduction histidine kinase (bacteriophytochrome)